MNERRFREQVATECAQLTLDLDALERGAPIDAVRFAARYRLLCQRLALAQQRHYGADLVAGLNELALRGHAQLYRRPSVHWLRDAVSMLMLEFPRALRRQWQSQLTALLLFLLPAAAALATISLSPERVHHFIDMNQVKDLEAMYDPGSSRFLRARPASGDLQMFGFYIANNIGIAFRTFASGLTFGVGSALFVFYNGLLLGAAAAHMLNTGMATTFFPFVIGHGAFELPAIVMAGGTGIALGLALLAPREHSRLAALQVAARQSVPVIYGFTSWLLLAAVLEAFWSSQHALGNGVRYAVGAVLWLAVTLFVLFSGRSRAA